MLKAIELENIRLFEGAGWKFNLAPLTVFCGTNNSGKSTLLKTLLLLRQSQGIDESYSIDQGILRFVGTQIDLGDYESFVSNNDLEKEVGIAITIEEQMVPVWFLMLGDMSTEVKDELRNKYKNREYIPSSLKVSFMFSAQNRMNQEEFAKTESMAWGVEKSSFLHKKGVLKKAKFVVTVDNVDLFWWEIQACESSKDTSPKYKISAMKPEVKLEQGSNIFSLSQASIRLNGIVPYIVSQENRKELIEHDQSPNKEKIRVSLRLPQLPSHMKNVVDNLLNALSNIHYLGPLRSPAQRHYITHLDARPQLDPAGEFLPYILRHQDVHKIWYVSPGQANTPQKGTLREALNVWMYYIRTGNSPKGVLSDEIEVETNQALVEFKVKNPFGNQSHALTDSGFGYSQILPIIVKGLLLPENSTLILEQPELHLNPALQVRLAAFFVSMVRSGKQVIIETHSEHMLNMIRVLAAEDESGELAAKCGLFFIDAQTGKPKIHDLSIQPNGTVLGWPRQFFGEAASLAGRLLRAQRRFRKQRKQK